MGPNVCVYIYTHTHYKHMCTHISIYIHIHTCTYNTCIHILISYKYLFMVRMYVDKDDGV